MLLAIIAGCEVGFWVVPLAGLTARYLLGLRRMGEALLVCVPLVDPVLLVATIRTCDAARAPTSPAGWPPPTSTSRSPSAPASSAGSTPGSPTASPAVRHHGRAGMGGTVPAMSGRSSARRWAWAISCALLLGGIVLVGDATRTAALLGWIGRLTFVVLVWLLWPGQLHAVAQ
jgi:hypothetical protein